MSGLPEKALLRSFLSFTRAAHPQGGPLFVIVEGGAGPSGPTPKQIAFIPAEPGFGGFFMRKRKRRWRPRIFLRDG